MEGLNNFLKLDGYGDGDGYSDGSGDGSGYGSGSGDGSGYGSGYSDGSGDGHGDGYGDGYGDGDGYGVIKFCGNDVHYIDSLPTVIQSVKGFIARGFVIHEDLTTEDVWVVRVGNSYAHGSTVEKAKRDAEEKHLLNSPIEERIQSFLNEFKGVDSIPAHKLFDWHFKLTGSCHFGRMRFVNSNGIDIEKDSFTIAEFIEITRGNYGSGVIEELEKQYLDS